MLNQSIGKRFFMIVPQLMREILMRALVYIDNNNIDIWFIISIFLMSINNL